MKELNIEIAVKIYDYEELDAADRELMDAAREATNRSYAPYSHFSVGAAARLANGIVVTGTNQENAAYPSGLCAERHHPILCQLPTSRPGSNHPRHCCTQRARRVPGVSHPALRRLPASDARNGEALQAANAGVAVWQKGIYELKNVGELLPLSFDASAMK